MPPLSPICSKILITLNLDGSVKHGQTDGRTDQQTGGQTLFQGCKDAFKSYTGRYPCLYGQVRECIRLHMHQLVDVHMYTVTHARRRNILLPEDARK